MKAVGYKVPGPIAEDASLVDIDLPRPVAEGGDILVEVKAVSVNPVDYKIRSSTPPADGDWKVLGLDAAGIVHARHVLDAPLDLPLRQLFGKHAQP